MHPFAGVARDKATQATFDRGALSGVRNVAAGSSGWRSRCGPKPLAPGSTRNAMASPVATLPPVAVEITVASCAWSRHDAS